MINILINTNVSQLTVSLDGATETSNDFIRGTGNFKLVTNNLRKAAEVVSSSSANMIIQVAAVVTRQNIASIYKLPKLLCELGISYLDVLKLYECGNAAINYTDLHISNEEYLSALGKIMIESYRNNIFTQLDCMPKVLDLLNSRYGFQVNHSNSSVSSCPAANNILYMDNKGTVFPCGPFSHAVANTSLSTNIFSPDFCTNISRMRAHTQSTLAGCSLSSSPFCHSCKYINTCSTCALCSYGHDDLCGTASQLYAK